VASGSAAFGGSILYIYWTKAATSLSATTSMAAAAAPNNVIVATYSGVAGLVVNYGQTIVNGANITAASINGNRVIANTLDGDTVLANTLSAATIKTSSLSAVEIDVSAGAGNIVISGANKWIKVADSGHDLVWIGALPGGGHGITIKDASGNIILSSGSGIPHSAVTGLGSLATASTVGAGSVTGLGAFALLNQLDPINASTYIAAATISQAHIIDLAVDTIKIAHGAVSDHAILNTVNGSVVLTLSDTGTVLADFSCDITVTPGSGPDQTLLMYLRWAGTLGAGAHTITALTSGGSSALYVDGTQVATRTVNVGGTDYNTSNGILTASAFSR
jgi:hypothetical protein